MLGSLLSDDHVLCGRQTLRLEMFLKAGLGILHCSTLVLDLLEERCVEWRQEGSCRLDAGGERKGCHHRLPGRRPPPRRRRRDKWLPPPPLGRSPARPAFVSRPSSLLPCPDEGTWADRASGPDRPRRPSSPDRL